MEPGTQRRNKAQGSLTMKSAILSVTVLLAGSAQAQNNVIVETPEFKPPVVSNILGEPSRTFEIEATMKICLGSFRASDGVKASWTPKEVDDYCGCVSVTLFDRTTQAQYDIRQKSGVYPDEWWVMRQEVGSYCQKKYVKSPNVTEIKNKKW
jgi:hypothetical protein